MEGAHERLLVHGGLARAVTSEEREEESRAS